MREGKLNTCTPLMLTIDLGTAGSKATLFDSKLREVSSSAKVLIGENALVF